MSLTSLIRDLLISLDMPLFDSSSRTPEEDRKRKHQKVMKMKVPKNPAQAKRKESVNFAQFDRRGVEEHITWAVTRTAEKEFVVKAGRHEETVSIAHTPKFEVAPTDVVKINKALEAVLDFAKVDK